MKKIDIIIKAVMTQVSSFGRLRLQYAGELGEPVAKPAVMVGVLWILFKITKQHIFLFKISSKQAQKEYAPSIKWNTVVAAAC